jgi:hypothetical protein
MRYWSDIFWIFVYTTATKPWYIKFHQFPVRNLKLIKKEGSKEKMEEQKMKESD